MQKSRRSRSDGEFLSWREKGKSDTLILNATLRFSGRKKNRKTTPRLASSLRFPFYEFSTMRFEAAEKQAEAEEADLRPRSRQLKPHYTPETWSFASIIVSISRAPDTCIHLFLPSAATAAVIKNSTVVSYENKRSMPRKSGPPSRGFDSLHDDGHKTRAFRRRSPRERRWHRDYMRVHMDAADAEY